MTNLNVSAEKRSRFKSYLKNNEIVFIKVNLNIADYCISDNDYFFRNDELVNYNENSIIYETDSTNQKAKKLVKITLYLDETEVLESSKF